MTTFSAPGCKSRSQRENFDLTGSGHRGSTAVPSRWPAVLLELGLTAVLLAALIGCQGVSAKSNTPTATGQLSANPASISFGNVAVGTTKKISATVTNSGGASVTVSQAAASGNGFTMSAVSLPLSLGVGQSATLSLSFSPQQTGVANGSVSLTSDASNSTFSVPLSATGVAGGTLVANPASVNIGSVQVGSTQSQVFQVTNSGTSSANISQATITGSGLTFSGLTLPSTLAPGASASLTVTFAPQASGTVNGNLAIVSDASNSTLNISVTGTGLASGSLLANPSSINFGNVTVGSRQTIGESLTNSSAASVTVSNATLTGAGFTFTGLTLPQTLAAGQSASFSVSFAPTANVNSSGSLVVTSNAANPSLSIPLSGSGVTASQLTVSPTSMNLGSVVVGQSQSSSGTLSASGSDVTVTSGTSSSGEFTLSGISFPLTITAGQNASFTVTFAPQSSGSASGTISFASNASNSPTVESVSGTGTAAQAHSVDLSWTASTSVVIGYNVYRGGTHGGPYSKINSTVDANTAYTDATVQSGATYYYVATAVDSSGGESAYSNEVQAVIPNP